MAEELTTPTPLVDSAPADVPSVEGLDQAGIADLLSKVNQGEQGGVKTGLEGALDDVEKFGDVNQPEKPAAKAPELDIPEKFRNPDGTLNSQNIVKSYKDVESSHGRVRNQLAQVNQEVSTLRTDIEDLTNENESLRAEIESVRQPEMSEQDRELLMNNPEAYKNKLQQELTKKNEEMSKKQRNEDSRINAMAARCRAELPGFSELESEMEKLSGGKVYSRHPDSIPEMYYAALGRKTASIAKMSREEGEKAGYARAKADLAKHVEAGGKSSAISDISSITKEQIDNATAEELAAMVPNHLI